MSSHRAQDVNWKLTQASSRFILIQLEVLKVFLGNLFFLGYGKRWRQIIVKLHYKGKEGKNNGFIFCLTG